MIDAELVPEALQKHWAFNGAKMTERENYKGQDIYYAEGGPHHDATSLNIEPGDEWMLEGYYISAFGVQMGRMVIGFPLYFKLNHDTHMKAEDRVKGRIGSAKHAAHEAVDAMLNVGLLERYSGQIVLPPGHA